MAAHLFNTFVAVFDSNVTDIGFVITLALGSRVDKSINDIARMFCFILLCLTNHEWHLIGRSVNQ